MVVATTERDVVVWTHDAELIWKGGEVPAEALHPGDSVWIAGLPLPDGSVAAQFIEANIVQLKGAIVALGAEAFEVESDHQRWAVQLDVDAPPELFRRSEPQPLSELGSLRAGSPVVVVGVETGSRKIRATRVFVS